MIRNAKILVSGGAGFIGSNLVDRLLEQNNEVVCLDNFSTGKYENIARALKDHSFTLIEGDIRNAADCQKAVKGCQLVLHQAALGSVPRSVADPATSTDVNIGGFVKMLFAAKNEGVRRFVYASSSSVYGDNPEVPKVEDRIGNALSPYAITKQVNELYARNFADIYGIETIGLRYFNVFGQRQDPHGAYAAVIPRFVYALLNHQSPVIYGDGTFSRDFTYIENVLQAIQLAATIPTRELAEKQASYYKQHPEKAKGQKPGSIAEVFNVAAGKLTSIAELGRTITYHLAKTDPAIALLNFLHEPERLGDVPHSLASCDKIHSILGYEPTYDLALGLEETCDWYRQTVGQFDE